MRRRDFLQVLVASASLRSAPAGAQKIARIGWMSANSPTATDANMSAFHLGMRELGYIEGQSYTVEPRFADGKTAIMSEQAAELERIGVNVIVAGPFAALQAARQSVTRVPIIMTPAADPVATGIVKNLDRPGGNITGITEMMPELTPERIRLLKEIMPALTRLAIMRRPGSLSEETFEQVMARSREVAGSLGISIQIVSASKVEDFDAAFLAMDKERAEALIVLVDPMFFSQRKEIVDRAAQQRLPAMYEWKQFVQAGGLVSYGADVPDVYRRAASIADKIIKGAIAGDIPIGRPTLFNMGVNLKTAAALGLTIPDRIRRQSVEIIE